MNYRYQYSKAIKTAETGSQYYVNTVYPEIPVSSQDNYVISTAGDRMDLLAQDFYGDVTLWWIISSANSLPGDSLYLEPGMQIRIPADLAGILNSYRDLNSSI